MGWNGMEWNISGGRDPQQPSSRLWLSPCMHQSPAAAVSGRAVLWDWVQEGEHLPKASSVRSLRVPPCRRMECGLYRHPAPAASAHAGPVPGLPGGLVCQAHLCCTPGQDSLRESWWGTTGRPAALPSVVSARAGRPVAPHAGL